MTYHLAIGDRMYSSWSLRGWLLFAAFDIPVKTTLLPMYSPKFAEGLKDFGLARLVPAVRIDEAPAPRMVWDTMAIAQTLHEDFPSAGIWPRDKANRALARTLAAEMHTGFADLREHCTMSLRESYDNFVPAQTVDADLARLEALWDHARAQSGATTPWLFGEYCAADAFFAPVAARIVGYKLAVGATAQAYVAAHLAHLPFRQWRAMAFAKDRVLDVYAVEATPAPWPGPAPLPARALETGTAQNATCPFSGKAIGNEFLAEIDGKTIGFCNAFCRDKSVLDPLAWPQVARLL